jgi:hypothetical protein
MAVKLTKFSASYLIVLVLLPWTAPWSVCGIADFRAAFTNGQGVPLPSSAVASITHTQLTDLATVVAAPVKARQRHLQLAVAASRVDSSHVVVPLRDSLASIRYPRSLTTLLDGDRSSAAVLTSLRL